MLKLHHFDRSPFGWKVRMALSEKNIGYQGIVPEKKSEDPEFAKLNPFRLTPVLVLDDGRAIFESTAICEYLEDRYPIPSLLPKDPYERARVRMLEDTTDQYLYPAIKGVRSSLYDWAPPHLVPKPADQVDHRTLETSRAKVHEHLGWLEQQLGRNRWFGGETFSLADVALAAPVAASLPLLGILPDDKYPGISAWIPRISERPSFKESAPSIMLTIKR